MYNNEDIQYVPTTAQDIHGRNYFLLFSENMKGVMKFSPMFKAPLYPPSAVLSKHPKLMKVMIDYDKWIKFEQQRLRNWKGMAEKYCRSVHGASWAKVLNDLSDEGIFEFAGEKPVGLEAVIAASKGNRWALGYPKSDGTEWNIEELPSWARAILPRAEITAKDVTEVQDPNAIILADSDDFSLDGEVSVVETRPNLVEFEDISADVQSSASEFFDEDFSGEDRDEEAVEAPRPRGRPKKSK